VVVGTLGLRATPLLALPGLAVAALLLGSLRRLRDRAPARRAPGAVAAEPAAWGPFARLAGAAVARTTAFFSLQAFIPVYLVRELGASPALAGAALTGMLAAGALGTLVGGRCADRFGRRLVLVWAMVPLIGLLALLPHAGLPVFLAAVLAIGLAVDAPFATTVVVGQEYLPGRVAFASGIIYGLAIGLGGLAATGMGALADAAGLRFALGVLPAFAVLALLLATTLPYASSSSSGRSGSAKAVRSG
jgi:FSR family fosmidomycin resistance protein-like MFS transporter